MDTLICMALRYKDDQKGCLQLPQQRFTNQSLFAPFAVIKKEIVFDRISGQRVALSIVRPIPTTHIYFDRSVSASC
jgi:hypothetical protein